MNNGAGTGPGGLGTGGIGGIGNSHGNGFGIGQGHGAEKGATSGAMGIPIESPSGNNSLSKEKPSQDFSGPVAGKIAELAVTDAIRTGESPLEAILGLPDHHKETSFPITEEIIPESAEVVKDQKEPQKMEIPEIKPRIPEEIINEPVFQKTLGEEFINSSKTNEPKDPGEIEESAVKKYLSQEISSTTDKVNENKDLAFEQVQRIKDQLLKIVEEEPMDMAGLFAKAKQLAKAQKGLKVAETKDFPEEKKQVLEQNVNTLKTEYELLVKNLAEKIGLLNSNLEQKIIIDSLKLLPNVLVLAINSEKQNEEEEVSISKILELVASIVLGVVTAAVKTVKE